MELLKTLTMEEAKKKVSENFKFLKPGIETVSIVEAVDRILAEEIVSPISIPEFNRSTVDGYAVIARDTFGASESLPGFLNKIGEVEMGKMTDQTIRMGECVYVPTGGMIPKGSDAVVMVEYTELLEDGMICIEKPVAPGENVLHRGDDIVKEQRVFEKGHRIRPQDIGALAGMGYKEIPVYKKLKVGIISTGDEIVSSCEELTLGKIIDMNTYSLSSAVIKDGCEITATAVVKDDLECLVEKLGKFLKESDLVLISGGSSMGTKDITKDAINQMEDKGVFIHGIAVKPGKPTIVGQIQGKPVFGLPGQPVSALVIYQTLVRSFIQEIYGENPFSPYILGEMMVNIPSAAGREHYVMVKVKTKENRNLVYPVYGKSGMITMMTKSMGYIVIETNQEGIQKGQMVKVYIF